MKGNGIYKNWRVIGASVFSAALVIAAYAIARDAGAPAYVLASTEEDLLKQIASKDSDGDGLPDWEEALYGTDPKAVDSKQLGMTDATAVAKGLIVPQASLGVTPEDLGERNQVLAEDSLPVPPRGTLTRAVSERVISSYTLALQRSPEGRLSAEDVQKLIAELVQGLDASFGAPPDFKKKTDLRIVKAGDAQSLKNFAAEAETVFLSNKAKVTKTPVDYLKGHLMENDPTALAGLQALAILYQDTAAGLAVLPVPELLADDHLRMVNALSRLAKLSKAFTQSETDPLTTMLALKQYTDVAQQLGTSFLNINASFKKAGVIHVPGEPGFMYVGFMDKVMEDLKAKKPPQP